MGDLTAPQTPTPAPVGPAMTLPALAAPAALLALRDQGAADVARLGWPTRKLETWRFTDIAAFVRQNWEAPAPLTANTNPSETPADVANQIARVVFVNGQLHLGLTQLDGLPQGVRVVPLHTASEADRALAASTFAYDEAPDGVAAAAAALASDGVLIVADQSVVAPGPIQIVQLGTETGNPVAATSGVVTANAVAIVVARNARLDIVETHALPPGARVHLPVVTARVHDNGELRHVKVQTGGAAAFTGAWTRVQVDRDARFRTLSLIVGGRVYRDTLHVTTAAPGGEVELTALLGARDGRLLDQHTRITHASGQTQSDQLAKAVLDEGGHVVFNGIVHILPGSQQVAAGQLNRNLLLHPKTQVDAKPQLEIYADDVKCGHGATIGRLEPEEVFYLQSRGLDPAATQSLLVRGFADEAIFRSPIPGLTEWLSGVFFAHFFGATAHSSTLPSSADVDADGAAALPR